MACLPWILSEGQGDISLQGINLFDFGLDNLQIISGNIGAEKPIRTAKHNFVLRRNIADEGIDPETENTFTQFTLKFFFRFLPDHTESPLRERIFPLSQTDSRHSLLPGNFSSALTYRAL